MARVENIKHTSYYYPTAPTYLTTKNAKTSYSNQYNKVIEGNTNLKNQTIPQTSHSAGGSYKANLVVRSVDITA